MDSQHTASSLCGEMGFAVNAAGVSSCDWDVGGLDFCWSGFGHAIGMCLLGFSQKAAGFQHSALQPSQSSHVDLKSQQCISMFCGRNFNLWPLGY